MKKESVNPYQAPKSDLSLQGAINFKELSYKELKSLRNHSHSIRALVILWLIGGCFAGFGIYTAYQDVNYSEIKFGFWNLYGMTFTLAMLLSITTFWRKEFSRWIGIVCCLLSLLIFPLGSILGALGLVAFINGKKLFGESKYISSELEKEFRYRRKNKIFD